MSPKRPSNPTADATPTFSATLEELESILRRIEEEEIDIDGLAAELGRAAALLELARSKIDKAETEVHQIVGRLEGDAAASQSDEE